MIERRTKEDKPVLAICYDFDRTLSPDEMQAQGFIQSVGCDVKEFWDESNELAKEQGMDQNLAYMLKMLEKAKGNVWPTRKNLADYGAKVKLFDGVEEWFERIRAYGKEHGVIVEHYIISSGLKEMIEGTSIARNKAFEQIYACSYYYDKEGVAQWPAQVVNYTNKTQFLFRIEKGMLDPNDQGVNNPIAPEKMRVPFRNIVYIGDSDTDIPCMKLVNSYGGHSIAVYAPRVGDKSKVHKMMREGRVKYYAAADYREGYQLDLLVKSIIERTAANETLENIYYERKKETAEFDRRSGGHQTKTRAMQELEESGNFANTHTVIAKLGRISKWTPEEIDELCRIAFNNGQVSYILTDADIADFFTKVIGTTDVITPNIKKMKERLKLD